MVKEKEKIERVVIKLPKSVADYFRREFPHGKRSNFVAGRIMEYKRQDETKKIENELGDIHKYRN